MTALMAATIAALEKPRLDDLTTTQVLPRENREMARRLVGKRDREHQAERDRKAAELLYEIVFEGIRVLRTRDGLPITDQAARERTNNIMTAIQGVLRLEVLP